MSNIPTNQNIYVEDVGSGIYKYKLGLSGTYNSLTFPCTIQNLNPSTNITVFFNTNITLYTSSDYFICISSNITFDGNNNTITLDNTIANYPGLIQNGSFVDNGNNNIIVRNFNVSCNSLTPLSSDAGYICQSYFSKNAINNVIQNCSSDGIINGSGGICGRYTAYDGGNLSILNCNSSGVMNGTYTGGICGPDAGSGSSFGNNGNVNITNCYSTGGLNAPYGGGICGYNAANVNITYCYSTGAIGVTFDYANGGIVGGYSAWNGGNTVVTKCYSLGTIGTGIIAAASNSGIVGSYVAAGGTLEISECYSFGNINSYASGICGVTSTNTTITNCYSLGSISSNAYGISYGMDGSFTSSDVLNINNCYSIGNIGANGAGICYGINGGPPSTGQTININNCYATGIFTSGIGLVSNPIPPTGGTINILNSFASGTGSWSDITANQYLTGFPLSGSPIVLGPTWNSITPNTPYLLSQISNDIYNPSSVNVNTLTNGIYTSSPGISQSSYTYELVNNNDPKISIDSTNGILTFNLGIDAPNATYAPNVFVYQQQSSNYYGYNFNSFSLTYTKHIPPTPVPISEICFPENTPIKIDQGIIPIQNINPKIHTINNKKIIAITKTISKDDYLVCFEKNSLKMNYPISRTIISKNHKLLYSGKMIEADYFAKKFDFIKKIKYNGQLLYNILMESHEIINVNGMLCETLHPKNRIALLYKNYIDDKTKSIIIEIMNREFIKNKRKSIKNLNII